MQYHYPTVSTLYQSRTFGQKDAMYLTADNRHMGVDIAGVTGTAIYAAADGRVAETYPDGGGHGYGRYIVICHDNCKYKTLYAHLTSIKVSVGDEVKAGDLIGTMGGDKSIDKLAGASTGSHLHFEVLLPTQPNEDFVKTSLGYSVEPLKFLERKANIMTNYVYRVIVNSGVNIRAKADVTSPRLRSASKGEALSVSEVVQAGGNLWARLASLREEWCAVKYNGDYLLELEKTANAGNEAATDDKRRVITKLIAHFSDGTTTDIYSAEVDA